MECGAGNRRRHPCQPRKNQALGIQRAAGEDSISQPKILCHKVAHKFHIVQRTISIFQQILFLLNCRVTLVGQGSDLKMSTTTTELQNIDTILK